MTPAITLWLAFVLAAATIIAARATKLQAIVFAIALALALPATLLPLGHAAPWKPAPGHYTVLGSKIEVDEAIWVLLDGPNGARFYKLPYTQQSANGLQRAMDMAEGSGGTVGLKLDGEGSPGFAEEGSGVPEPGKVPEAAIID